MSQVLKNTIDEPCTQEKLWPRLTCRCDELYLGNINNLWLWHASSGMAGCVQVSIEASNEPCIHKTAMLRAETAARPVALLQSNCGNDRQSWDSMHVSPAGCRRDEPFFEKIKMLWLWNVALGMAGCFKVCIEASNEPCIHKSALDVACRDSGWTKTSMFIL